MPIHDLLRGSLASLRLSFAGKRCVTPSLEPLGPAFEYTLLLLQPVQVGLPRPVGNPFRLLTDVLCSQGFELGLASCTLHRKVPAVLLHGSVRYEHLPFAHGCFRLPSLVVGNLRLLQPTLKSGLLFSYPLTNLPVGLDKLPMVVLCDRHA